MNARNENERSSTAAQHKSRNLQFKIHNKLRNEIKSLKPGRRRMKVRTVHILTSTVIKTEPYLDHNLMPVLLISLFCTKNQLGERASSESASSERARARRSVYVLFSKSESTTAIVQIHPYSLMHPWIVKLRLCFCFDISNRKSDSRLSS